MDLKSGKLRDEPTTVRWSINDRRHLCRKRVRVADRLRRTIMSPLLLLAFVFGTDVVPRAPSVHAASTLASIAPRLLAFCS